MIVQFINIFYAIFEESFHSFKSVTVPFVQTGQTGHFFSDTHNGGFGGVGYQSFGGINE